MRIKDLPTKKLRELALARQDTNAGWEEGLESAFSWGHAAEGFVFWYLLNENDFEQAYALRPDLF
jgi:hypothetical protein